MAEVKEHAAEAVSYTTFKDGGDQDITTDDILKQLKHATETIKATNAIKIQPMGRNLARIDFDIEALTSESEFAFEAGTVIPIGMPPTVHDAIRADLPYVADFSATSDERGLDIELWATSTDALKTEARAEAWKCEHIFLVNDEDEQATANSDVGNGLAFSEFGIDPQSLFLFKDTENGRSITLSNAVSGLAILSMSVGIAERMRSLREEDAITIRSGAIISQYVRGATRRNKTKRLTLKNRKGETVVVVNGIEDALALKPSGRKTFTLIDREATRMSMAGEYRHDGKAVCRVLLSVAEVAGLYGITEESARKRLRRDFKAIANESLTIQRRGGWLTIPVAGGAYGIRGDNAIFTLSPDMMQLIFNPTAPQTDLPRELYSTDDTNYPAAFQIGLKLYAHDNANDKQNGAPRDRMRLATMLDAARELPTPDEMERARRSKTERIMGPFEACMNHLVDKGVLTDWDYCHENGEPLTREEYEAVEVEHDLGKPTPWDMAKDWLVTWELGKRYPMHEAARRASREKRLEAAKEARAKKDKEAKASERRVRGKVEAMRAKKLFEAEEKEAEPVHT